MAEKQVKNPNQEIALFRYGIICDIINDPSLDRQERRRLVKEKSARKWQIPYSARTRISAGTIYKWIRDYTAGGYRLESLYPKSRSDRNRSRAMDADTCAALVELRKEKPGIPIRELIRLMYREKRVTPGIDLKPTTVYRFLHQNGLMDMNSLIVYL